MSIIYKPHNHAVFENFEFFAKPELGFALMGSKFMKRNSYYTIEVDE